MEKARQEYCEYMYNRIVEKLSQAEEWELLSFALLGMNLLLRQSDILRLTWDQVDFVNRKLRNVLLIKGDKMTLVDHYDLDYQLVGVLNKWLHKTNEHTKIFSTLKRYMASRKIGEMVGSRSFNSHDLRGVGIYLSVSNEE